jgi:hypothetical protein
MGALPATAIAERASQAQRGTPRGAHLFGDARGQRGSAFKAAMIGRGQDSLTLFREAPQSSFNITSAGGSRQNALPPPLAA